VASTRADTADLARVQLDALLERIVGDDLEWVVYSSTPVPTPGLPPEKWPQRCLAQLSHKGATAVGPLPEPDSPQWGHAARQLVHACRDVARRLPIDLSEPVFVGGAYWNQLDEAGRVGQALAQALRRGGAGGMNARLAPPTLAQLAEVLDQAEIGEYSADLSYQEEVFGILRGFEAVPREGLGLAIELRGELPAELARGQQLDALGQELGLVRGDGESDADFRLRIRRFHRPLSERLSAVDRELAERMAAPLARRIGGTALRCEARAEGPGGPLRCIRDRGHPGLCDFMPT
jgi:hypothetical protein